MTRHDPTDATDDGRTDATDAPTTWRDDQHPTDAPPMHAEPVRYGGTELVEYSDGTPAVWVQTTTDALVDLEANR